MSALYLYDDLAARRFEPFISTRPCGELRAGALLIRERWERALGMPVAGYISADHLRSAIVKSRATSSDDTPR